MAKSNTENGKVKPFLTKKQTGEAAPAEPQAQESEPPPVNPPPVEPPPAPEPERRRGRPKGDEPPKALTFWARIAKVNPDDWGTRAKIKVYRLAPIINRLATQEHKFICIYGSPGEPALTENQLTVDHGSGKYRLYFNWKAPGSNDEQELDRVEVSILNPDYPPKIPPGEWLDDPRNKAWAWAKPKDAQGQTPSPAPLDQVADILALGKELRKEAREELMQTAPPAPAAPASPATSGIKEVFEAAGQVLQMRSDNPMVAILQDEVKAMREELRSEREASRKFEAQLAEQRLKALEEKLAAAITSQTKPAEDGDWLDKLEKAEERKERLKALFGGGETGNRRRSFGEMALDWGAKILESPAMAAVGQAIAQRVMMGPPPQPGVTGAAQVPPGPELTPEQEFQQFIPYATTAMMGYLSNSENTGDMFADWMYAGWPDKFAKLKTLTHPMMPGQQGAPVIIAFYQHSPYWQAIKAFEGGEERFKKFVADFCAYKPDSSEKSQNIPEAEHEDVEDAEEKTTELEV